MKLQLRINEFSYVHNYIFNSAGQLVHICNQIIFVGMKRRLFLLLLLWPVYLQSDSGGRNFAGGRELEIVFCVDLSGSTNGLINDVKDNIWHIINQAELLTPKPALKIGIVAFSRPSFKKESSYVKVLCDLTPDFDFLVAELSKIRPSIEKGDQYVGAAIRKCVNDITWSYNDNTKKIIYIVGNGNVADAASEHVRSCELAVKKGIVVNAIYVVGKNKAKELQGWHHIASMGGGLVSEMVIGFREDISNENIQHKEIFNAMRSYNLTCCYYTPAGFEKYMNYRKSDSVAFDGGNGAFYERAYYKTTHLSKVVTPAWDLVELYRSTGLMPPVNDSLMYPDSLKQRSSEYIYDLVKVLKSERQRAIIDLKKYAVTDYPSRIHQQYISGEMDNDKHQFSRAVVNMLIKQYP